MTDKQNGAVNIDDTVMASVKISNGLDSPQLKEEKLAQIKPRSVQELEDDLPWKDLTSTEKCRHVVVAMVKVVALLLCLYVFICSLGLLEDSFKLLGGKTAGATFRNNKILQNPVAGLMIGVLATVLVQSSSTSTSIVITMVGAEVMPIRIAIPIIMGANIGTSVTNTIVSLAQAGDKTEFRRAFSGATVHDMFNWLAVLVLLPLEVVSGYLYKLTQAIVNSMNLKQRSKNQDFLKAITKPLTELVVQVNKNVITDVAVGGNNSDSEVMKRWCKSETVLENITVTRDHILFYNCTQGGQPEIMKLCTLAAHDLPSRQLGNVSVDLSWQYLTEMNNTRNEERCGNLFAQTDWPDAAIGGVLLVVSLLLLLGALFAIVKLLHSLLRGSVAKVIKKTINADFPGRCAYFTGYVAILVGCGMTMIIQSSSVFTSTLTPLVGVGIVSVERMYPMTLGANIGTTLTGILAALSVEPEHIADALHVALCHLFFNITGVLLFYPIPFMRWPIGLAKTLGRTTSEYRWFAIFYLIVVFLLLPGSVFGLSMAGDLYLFAVGGPLLGIFLVVVVINVLQKKVPHRLPRVLKNWNWLPRYLRSWDLLDMVIVKLCVCGCCRRLQVPYETDDDDIETGRDNRSYVDDERL